MKAHPNLRARLGAVTGFDLAERQVQLGDGSVLGYDALVVAAGAVTADFGVPGVVEYAFPLKQLGDAVALRNHLVSQFELAGADPSAVDEGALTFVVVGGGPTGVELAGALSELVGGVLAADFPEIDVSCTRIVLAESAPSLLGTFSVRLRGYAAARLERLGVEVRTATPISAISADLVRFADGTALPTRTVVWAAGVHGHPLGRALGGELQHAGRVRVDATLRLPGHPDVFVIGDMAAAPPAVGGPHPQLAPVALQQGRYVADAIVAQLRGQSLPPFAYRDKGTMATIGRHAAVAELPAGLRLTGVPAWLAWLLLHLIQLIGVRNRASVLLNWAWGYLTFDRGLRAVFDPTPRSSPGDRPQTHGHMSRATAL